MSSLLMYYYETNIMKCYLICINFLGRLGGRTDGRTVCVIAEFSRTNFSSAYFNLDLMMLIYLWIDLKNTKGDGSCATTDFENFDLCWVHSLFCVTLLTPGQQSTFMCPVLANKTSNAINKWMNETFAICLNRNVPGVTTRFSGTSLRSGSINLMLASPHVTIYEGIMRSAHTVKEGNNIFEYAYAEAATLAISARALAGWPNPRMLNYPPSLTALKIHLARVGIPRLGLNGAAAVQLLRNFALSFLDTPDEFRLTLTEFLEMLLATFLRTFDDFIRKYTVKHVVYIAFISKAATFDIPLAALLEWGVVIQHEYEESNKYASVPLVGLDVADTWIKKMVHCERGIEALSTTLGGIQINTTELEKRISKQESILTEILNLSREQHGLVMVRCHFNMFCTHAF